MKKLTTTAPLSLLRASYIAEPGDIVLVQGKGWLSDNILKAEYYGMKPPADGVSHTGVITAAMSGYEPQITEALTRVRTHPLSVTLASANKVWILKTDKLNVVQRSVIVQAALGFSGQDYGYLDLVLQWLDQKTGSNWWTRKGAWFLNDYPICSFVVAESYGKIGWTFGKDQQSVTPRDIGDYGKFHKELYQPLIPLLS